ncbi:MAG: hypothetical protein JWO80_235 [Bryobacterales bacterium]|nr:hypothetical protein [Bryobacterales bacterium]
MLLRHREGKRPNHAGSPRRSTCVLLLLMACLGAGCSRPEVKTAPGSSEVPASTGAVTIDARVSGGTRFVAYANDVWAKPTILPLTLNQWHEYRFEVPANVTSFRFDPSELSGVSAEIRNIRFELPGQTPRALPLEDLPKWLKYNCEVVYDPAMKTATVKSTGRDMYTMSTVNINYMRRE